MKLPLVKPRRIRYCELDMDPSAPTNPQSRFKAAHAFLRRHWQRALRIREKLVLSEEAFHLIMAGGVGVLGGLINLLFYHSVDLLQWLFVGMHVHNVAEAAEGMSEWRVLLTPVLGALAAGLVLTWGLRFVGRQGTTNLLEVVVAGDGRLPFRSGIIRTISSMLSISSGASIGREGAITQLAATAASKWGQVVKWEPYRLRLLVACGAASGMSAAYNAPIAGAVFAAQIVLGNFSMNLFAPVLFSSVIASMLSRSFFGVRPWYEVPAFDFTSVTQLPWFLLLGALAGVLGASFLKLLIRSEELFARIPGLLWRMAIGGLVVGAIGLLYPEVWGNGYVVTNTILHNQLAFGVLAAVFIAKFAATVVTVGSGAVGGVFTPTLFLGAGLGGIMGTALHHFGLAPEHLPVGAFALVGMGSMLAATTRSPLLAIIMMLEISLNYSIMPALMLGCAVSTLVARGLHPKSIYTQPLKLRSLEVESYRLGVATERTVGDLMHAPVDPVLETTMLPDIAERFLSSPNNFLPVVDSGNHLVGIVSLHDLKEYLTAGRELQAVIAYDVMRPAPACLTPNQKLMDALPILLSSEQKNISVVNSMEEKRLVGSVPRVEALAFLSEAIASSTATTTSVEPDVAKTAQ